MLTNLCKALIFAHEDSATYGKVLKSVAGVIFLGTPHRGSSVARLGSVVGSIINFPGLPMKAVRTDLLDYLKLGSCHLQDLAVSVRNRLADLAVVSFYETEAQSPLPSVVGTRNTIGTGKHQSLTLQPDRGPRIRSFEHTWRGCHFAPHKPPRSLSVLWGDQRIQICLGSSAEDRSNKYQADNCAQPPEYTLLPEKYVDQFEHKETRF